MTVRDIMDSDAPFVRASDDVESVVHLLRERDLPGVPVVNDGGRCVGIVTVADLIVSEDDHRLHLPYHVELFGAVVFLETNKHYEERLRHALASEVSELMTRDPVTVEPDADVRDAARVISREGHNRLPVVEHGRLVGVVTRLDVLDALAEEE